MDFSQALESLKDGHALTRKVWIWGTESAQTKELLKTVRFNSDRKKPFEYGVPFVVVMTALTLPPFNTQDTSKKVNDRTAEWIGKEKPLESQPYFAHYDPISNKWQPGWVPSVSDIFAEDWLAL